MRQERRVSIVCEECGGKFAYKTRAKFLKTFCPGCSTKRIDASKRRSKERLAGREEKDLTDAEVEARLERIPDREVGWNRWFDLVNRGTR